MVVDCIEMSKHMISVWDVPFALVHDGASCEEEGFVTIYDPESCAYGVTALGLANITAETVSGPTSNPNSKRGCIYHDIRTPQASIFQNSSVFTSQKPCNTNNYVGCICRKHSTELRTIGPTISPSISESSTVSTPLPIAEGKLISMI